MVTPLGHDLRCVGGKMTDQQMRTLQARNKTAVECNFTARRDRTYPIKPVFAPTGWTTVALDHITFRVVDPRAEAAFYAAVLGWTLRADDGTQHCSVALRSFTWVIDRSRGST